MSLAHEPNGHKQFIDRIIAAALQRHARRQKVYRVRFTPATGYAMWAARDLAAGEVVQHLEVCMSISDLFVPILTLEMLRRNLCT